MGLLKLLIFYCHCTLINYPKQDSIVYPFNNRVTLETQYIRVAKNYQQLKRLLAIMPLSSPQWDYIPSIFPVKTNQARISSRFGNRIHPIDGNLNFHSAIDIPCGYKENIYATASGLVVRVIRGNAGLGNYVIIDHINGFTTLYGHLTSCRAQAGEFVIKGQVIGLAGSTGKSTGVHVHYGIKKDRINIDPYPFCFVSKIALANNR